MVCTYWWWFSVTAEREVSQDKPLEAVRSVQCAVSRKTELYKHKSLSKTCMSKSMVKFKGARPVSKNEVGFLYRIPVMLRQQQCWKFGSIMGNVDISLLRKLWRQNAAFSESFETHQRLYYRAKCVGANWVAITVDCEWVIRGGGLLGAEQPRFSLMRLAVPLLQLSHCAACSNIQHCLKLRIYCCRVKLKCDGTRWRTGGEVKGKMENGACSQYSSHYLEI